MYVSVFLPALFSEKVRNMSPDEIRIPPEPPGRCSSQLQVDTPPLLYDYLTTSLSLQNFSCLFKGNILLLSSGASSFCITTEATVMSPNQTRGGAEWV